MRERRRLLERLEHLVGRLVVDRVGALDDEHAPARLERRARRGGDDRLVDVADEHLGGAAGVDPCQVGMDAVLDAPPARVVGSAAPSASSSAANARAASRLPAPAGPWKRYACEGAPAGRERRGQDRAGVRVAFDDREHARGRVLSVRAGRLITIEGIDGAGKTTLAPGLVTRCGRRLDVELLREPGGVELSERIRALVKDPALAVDPRAEALLYAAARAQLVGEVLAPLLDAGRWVLLDRFVDSSLAYQGAGRGLGVADGRGDQRLRHRRPDGRPDAAAARRRHEVARRAARRRRTGSSRPARRSSRGRRGLRRARRAEPASATSSWTARPPRTRCWPRPWRS